MEEVMSLEGPVLRINGELMLFIPLDAGGDELVECSRGISEVQGRVFESCNSWMACRNAAD